MWPFSSFIGTLQVLQVTCMPSSFQDRTRDGSGAAEHTGKHACGTEFFFFGAERQVYQAAHRLRNRHAIACGPFLPRERPHASAWRFRRVGAASGPFTAIFVCCAERPLRRPGRYFTKKARSTGGRCGTLTSFSNLMLSRRSIVKSAALA